MRRMVFLGTITVFFTLFVSYLYAVEATPGELEQARLWAAEKFSESPDTIRPFSFKYADQSSTDWFKKWTCSREEKELDPQRSQITLEYRDLATGLVVRCVAVAYQDFPAVEWTLYFKNTGTTDTPLLENIQALDQRFERGAEGEFMLRYHTGGLTSLSAYQPFETVLGPKSDKRVATAGGRPTNAHMPFFNIRWPDEGVLVVIGWPGQWAAQFTREEGNGLRVQAGQELTHFVLHPNEEVRSPLVVLQFWDGDWVRAQNIWRRWMITHNLPRQGNQIPPPLCTPCSSHQFAEMVNANEENQKYFIDRYWEEGFKPDYWWMDAGWYVGAAEKGWPSVGTWEVDRQPQRFPNGLRAISDHAHSKGVKIIVWFETERVAAETWLATEHPDWILGGASGGLLNLGNPEAQKWLVNHIDKMIREEGIDLYRQDFNIEPLPFWRNNDSENRQGITENKYIMGFLAYWDELRRRHPEMLIDSCSSGGNRNDLEVLRRAVPLLRSDYAFEPVGEQCHMYGLSFWMPYNGTGFLDRTTLQHSKLSKPFWVTEDGSRVIESDSYLFRSVMSMHLTPCLDMRDKDVDYASLRRLLDQWREVAPNYYGDYYPLTTYTVENNTWMAWQFDRPEVGMGLVQAFRRGESSMDTITFKLYGLESAAQYEVLNLDESHPQRMLGSELMKQGIPIHISEPSAAVVITYQRLAK